MIWLVGLILLGVLGWLLWLVNTSAGPDRRAERLLAEFEGADQVSAEQHRQARQAMNRAAGQDWRNLAG